MSRISAILIAVIVVAGLTVSPAAAGPGPSFPDSIDLPDGFFPEGIAIDGQRAYVGSLVDGAIQVLDLKAGTGEQFAGSPGPNKISVGMDVDRRDRLWVAGGGSGFFPGVEAGYRVYDTDTGALLADVPLPGAGFVNDVIVTRKAAWFTDTFGTNLVRVPIARDGTIGAPEIVALTGDYALGPGPGANGIVATRSGQRLVMAQIVAPEGGGAAYYSLDADLTATELPATRIALDGPVASADGLVLVGRILYSVGAGVVTEIRLSGQLDRGRIEDVLEVPGAVSPTTADLFRSRLYVVDAKFPNFGDPTTPFAITAIRR